MQLRRQKMRVCGKIIDTENALIILMDLADQTIEGRLISTSVAARLYTIHTPGTHKPSMRTPIYLSLLYTSLIQLECKYRV